MNDIADRKMNDAVTIGVAISDMVGGGGFAIQMQGHLIIKSHYRYGSLWGWRDSSWQKVVDLLGGHALMDIVVRNDHRAGFADRLIAASVVEMIMSVDYEANRLVTNLADRFNNCGLIWLT